MLGKEGQHTVFVPTNDAIQRYGEAAWAELLGEHNRLRALTIIFSRRAPARLLDGSTSFVTVEGRPLLSDSRGGEIIVEVGSARS